MTISIQKSISLLLYFFSDPANFVHLWKQPVLEPNRVNVKNIIIKRFQPTKMTELWLRILLTIHK